LPPPGGDAARPERPGHLPRVPGRPGGCLPYGDAGRGA